MKERGQNSPVQSLFIRSLRASPIKREEPGLAGQESRLVFLRARNLSSNFESFPTSFRFLSFVMLIRCDNEKKLISLEYAKFFDAYARSNLNN